MNSVLITKVSTILRLLALSVLFGGGASTIFIAVSLITIAEAHGVPTLQAAFANAPIFIVFSKLSFGAAIALIIGESLNYAATGQPSKLKLLRYVASLSCAALVMVFAFAVVPPMKHLLMSISTSPSAHLEFHQLHKTARIMFGSFVFLALVSLMIPVFEISSTKDPV